VIGAQAVVTKDVPPYTVAMGNPARVMKQRFSDDVIEQLLDVAWWDLPRDKIAQLAPFLLSNHVIGLITKARDLRE
jgi:carbonic anhydrase/acetyltransferase-like protein (isoleucine patch superfamily)